MIITLDGPSGAGKSSTAKALASELGFEFLDTGAMYRAVALAALRANIALDDQDALAELVANLHLDISPGRIVLDGEDISGLIRSAEVTKATSAVADSRVVREKLVELQRKIGSERDIITEGRDQGTIVFPDAACKFFLSADLDARAGRRFQEMTQAGEEVDLAEVTRAMKQRDERDAARDLAPMKPASDAILVDNTRLALDEVVTQMAEIVRRTQNA